MSHDNPNIKILSQASPQERSVLDPQIERLFFDTAKRLDFNSPEARQLYYQRWCGKYADIIPEAFLYWQDDAGALIGYVAGCFDSFLGNAKPIIADIFYYSPAVLAELTAYPAHFHINVDPAYQSQGCGIKLLAYFIELCRTRKLPGIHVITASDAIRVLRFYQSAGFALTASANLEQRLQILTLGL